MYYLLGIILCVSAAYKFKDVQGFAKEFQQYDIIAKRIPVYGYLFPYLELFSFFKSFHAVNNEHDCICYLVFKFIWNRDRNSKDCKNIGWTRAG